MKPLAALVFILCFIVMFCSSTLAQFRAGVQLPDTTSSITVLELQNPSLQQLHFTDSDTDSPSSSKVYSLNKTSKFLLGIGATLIRGNNENHSLYSLENAWKYPGPTVRYPETITEYEQFLRRYNEFRTDQ